MRVTKQTLYKLIFVAATTLFILLLPHQQTNAQTSTAVSATTQLKNIWQRANRAAAYTFASDIRQTTHPTADVTNIGRRPRTNRLRLNGHAEPLAQRMEMSMTLGTTQQHSTAVKVENGTAYIQDAQGQWQESRELLDVAAPGGDPFGYLSAMENVQRLSPGQNPTNDAFPAGKLPEAIAATVTRYAFTINGPAYAAYMQQQLDTYLKQHDGMPHQFKTALRQDYAHLQGQGEIWVNAAGLPTYQHIHFQLPPNEGANEWHEVTLTTDFANWQQNPIIAALQNPQQRGPSPSSPLSNPQIPILSVQQTQQLNLILFTLLFISLTLILLWHHTIRPVRRFLTSLLVLSLLAAPIDQMVLAHQADTFRERHNQRTADFEQKQSQQETQQQTRNELKGAPFQPTVPPALQNRTQNKPLNTGTLASTHRNSEQIRALTAVAATTGTDTDGDTLDDEVEIYELGTYYDVIDSDGDLISDDKEVSGFDINGQTWYLNPLDLDSNNDTLTDSAECPQRINVDTDGTAIPTATITPCRDIDGDNIPDVYDFDNDGDGVPDSVDTTPNYTGTLTTQAQESFNFNLSDYTTDKPIELSLQLRPIDPDHIYLTDNVFDWPDPDIEGQVTRVFTDTFADYGYTNDNSSYGDMMIVPRLEVEIPWNATNPSGGLPISSSITINQNTDIDQWLDTAVTDDYNLSVNKDTDDGTLYVYIPLTEVQDDIGDAYVAWEATLPYRPDSGTWGSDHQVRLVWYVFNIVDECNTDGMDDDDTYEDYCDTSNPNVWESDISVVQTYYESFYLTGLTLREEHGLTGMLAAQNNAADNNNDYENYLWHLAYGMKTAFLESETLSDSSRFDIEEIVTRFDDDSNTYANGTDERWGIPTTALNVISTTGTTTKGGLSDLIETELPALLDTTYPTATAGITVTILRAHETIYRSLSLAQPNASYNSSNNTLSLSFADAYAETYAAMAWSPYVKTSDSWQSADTEIYYNVLENNLNTAVTNSEIDNTLNVADADDTLARDAAIQMGLNYYIAINSASSRVVDIGGEIVGGNTLTDTEYILPSNSEATLYITNNTLDNLLTYAVTESAVTLDGEEVITKAYYEVDTATKLIEGIGALVQQMHGQSDNTQIQAWLDTNLRLVQRLLGDAHTIVTNNSKNSQKWGEFQSTTLIVNATIIVEVLAETPASDSPQAVNILLASFFVALTTYIDVYGGFGDIIDVYRALDALDDAWTSVEFASAASAMNNITLNWSFSIAIGYVLNVAFAVIFFLMTVASANVKTNSIEYQLLVADLAGTIAAETIIFVLLITLLAIAVATGGTALLVYAVVLLLIALIRIVDTIMALLCATGVTNNDFACTGIVGSFADALADALYDYHVPINLDRDDRLNISLGDIILEDTAKGIEAGNQLTFQIAITSSIYKDEPNFDYIWKGTVNSGIKRSHLDNAIFTYTLQTDPVSTLPLPNNTDWQHDGDWPLYAVYTDSLTYDLSSPRLNQKFEMYLTEAFKIPVMSCWVRVCDRSVRYENTGSIYLGDQFVFDIFPSSFSGFINLASVGNSSYRQSWDGRFATLMDADGDGLISQAFNGIDPNDSKPDTDEDGLSDTYELANSADGFDPQRPDGDGDGLTDYWELFYSTDPLNPDSDNDGLLDGEELFHANTFPGDTIISESWSGGWNIVYDYIGNTPQQTWVTSNPNYADSDLDSILDKLESIYGYNPNILNDFEILDITAATITVPGDKADHVKPGDTFTFTLALENLLDSIFISRGLIEAELPRDVVQNTTTFSLTGQATLTTTGTLYVDPNHFTTSEAVSATLRAGAFTERVDAEAATRTLAMYFPMTYQVKQGSGSGAIIWYADISGNERSAKCRYGGGSAPQVCPIQHDGYAEFVHNDDNADSLTWEGYGGTVDSTAFTFSFWVRPTGDNTEGVFWDNDGDVDLLYMTPGLLEDEQFNINIDNDGETVYATLNQGGTSCSTLTANAPTTLVYNSWNHVALTYDGNDIIIYLNGEAGTPTAVSSFCDELSYMKFGLGYNGDAKDLAVYERTLSPVEIQREWETGFRLVDFNFNESPGRESYADSRNMGFLLYCTDEATCPEGGRPGMSNQALAPDGSERLRFAYLNSSGHQNNADSDIIGLSMENNNIAQSDKEPSFTFLSWIYANSWPSNTVDLLNTSGSVDGVQYDVQMGFHNSRPVLINQSSVSGTITHTVNITLATKAWHHVAYQYHPEDDDLHIFVDGIELLNEPATQFYIAPDSQVYFAEGFDGLIDHTVLTGGILEEADVQAIMAESPLFNLHFDEDLYTTDFTNDGILDLTVVCSGNNCPNTGDHGQMREAPIFNGDGSLDDTLTIGGNDLADLVRPSYSIVAWVYPEDIQDGSQILFAYDTDQLYAPVISITNNLEVVVDVWTGQNGACTSENHTQITSNNTLIPEQWNHIIVSRNDSNTFSIYLNGTLDENMTSNNITTPCDSSTTVEIGKGIIGKIDELAFYGSALSDIEVDNLYNYQVAWYDVRYLPTLQVDTEPPTATIFLPTGHLLGYNGELLFVDAVDQGGSDIEEIVVTLHVTSTIYTPAVYLKDSAWYTELPLDLAEGTYAFTTQARDSVGYTSIATQTFTVDQTSPTVTYNDSGTVLAPTPALTLTGTISDVRSGIVEPLQLRLVHDNTIEATSWSTATVTGPDWHINPTTDNTLYGRYTLLADVQDALGNRTTQEAIGTVIFDGADPYADVAMLTTTITNSAHTFYGAVYDIPYPNSNRILHLHFEAGNPFADSSGDALTVTCTHCPSTGQSGNNGTATGFDGLNDALTIDLYGGLDQEAYTLMAWLYLTDTTTTPATLFNAQSHTAVRFNVALTPTLDALLVSNGTITTSVPITLPLNSWHHLALVVRDSSWTGYVDGVASNPITQTFPITTDVPLYLGAMGGTTNHFMGLIDEVAVYNHTLTHADIYNIANPVTTDITSLELRLRHLQDEAQADAEGTWIDITPATTSNSYATWSYDMPDALEGPYKLDLKIADSHGYTRTILNAWGGVIDTLAPRLTLSVTTNISNERTLYCQADDQYLDAASWNCPLTDTPTATYEDASWWLDAFSQTNHLISLQTGPSITTTTTGLSLTACDTYGNCTTQTYAGAVENIPGIEEFMIVYALDLPTDADYSSSAPNYTIDNSSDINNFDRIAYYLELDNGVEKQWVWAEMNPFTNTITAIGIPHNHIFEQQVDKLFVATNANELTTGGPFNTGNIEFWHNCYNQTADSSIDGDSSRFDFDDTVGAANCYGSMQIHNYGTGETILAWNGWADSGTNDDIGIGTNAGTNPDWTSEANSNNWLTRTLYTLVHVPLIAAEDAYTVTGAMTLTVPAAGVMSNDQAGLTATLEQAPTNGTLTFASDGAFIYTPTLISGNDSFRYSLTDGIFLTDTATVNITIDPARCYVETNGNQWADAVGDDITILQNAIDEAADGATIKVAGTCAGVQQQAGLSQTLYITNDITIMGGYTATAWLDIAQPHLYPAILNAQGKGRVVRVTSSGRFTATGVHFVNGNGTIQSLDGAGIYNEGVVSLNTSTFQNNNTNRAGGGIYNDGTLIITNSHFLTNTANGSGGGISNHNILILSSTVISGNKGNSGAGVFNRSTGNMLIQETVIRNNQSTAVGGGLTNRGDSTVQMSTIMNNVSLYEGGGIYNYGTFTLTNSTVSGNLSKDDTGFVIDDVFYPFGGGGAIRTGGDMLIQYSSIISNNAPYLTQTAGIVFDSGEVDGSLTITASVVAYNNDQNCYYFDDPIDSAINNIADDDSCGTGFTNTEPLLSALIDDGTNTPYHHPFSSSPLVDVIATGVSNCNVGITNDQRDVSRPQEGACDIGAIEVVQTTVTPTLTIGIVNDITALLTWGDDYQCSNDLYRSTSPYSGFTLLANNVTSKTYQDTQSIGKTNINDYYYLEMSCWGNSTNSNTVAEFDLEISGGD